jgi:hypothetical protein
MKKNVACEEKLELKCDDRCFFQREVFSFEANTLTPLCNLITLNLSCTRINLSALMSEGTIRIGSKVIVSGREEFGAAVVRFIGSTKFAAGEWIGVEYELPGIKKVYNPLSVSSNLSKKTFITLFINQFSSW